LLSFYFVSNIGSAICSAAIIPNILPPAAPNPITITGPTGPVKGATKIARGVAAFEAVVGVLGGAATNNDFNSQTLLLCNKNI
jgi:hypothetical protein